MLYEMARYAGPQGGHPEASARPPRTLSCAPGTALLVSWLLLTLTGSGQNALLACPAWRVEHRQLLPLGPGGLASLCGLISGRTGEAHRGSEPGVLLRSVGPAVGSGGCAP